MAEYTMNDERFTAYLHDLPAHMQPRDEQERDFMFHAYLQGVIDGTMSMYEAVTADLIEGARK